MNKKTPYKLCLAAAALVCFIFAVMLITCSELEGILLPVHEPPNQPALRGKVFFHNPPGNSNLYKNYKAVKVHLYFKDYTYIGSAPVNENDFTWQITVNSINKRYVYFWVELSYNGETFYNSGAADEIIDGMYYELHVRPSGTIPAWRPVLSADDIKNIGYNAYHPADGNYILVKNIDIYAPWTSSAVFTGTFYGRNNTINIYGLSGETNQYSGIFSRISNALIYDLVLNVQNVAVSLNVRNEPAFGVLAGCIEGKTVLNRIQLEGSRLLIQRNGLSAGYAGGFAGIMRGESIIKNCTNELEIDAEIQSPSLFFYAGGIAGFIDEEAKIYQCANKGDIHISNLQGWASAGGIAGGIAYNADNATPQIHDSYSTGKINCQADLAAAGGIAGVSQGYAYIKDCYTQGDVLAATISGTIYSAGILGKAFRTNPNVVLPDPPTASRVYNCAVFQQNIKGAKDESTSAADYINRITRIDCPDCENPLVVCESSASSGCTCGWTSNDILFVDTSAMQPTYNTTERYCSLMLNDRPIFGKDTMNCHSGTIVLGITAVLLQNSGWDFSNVWYWSAQNKPELMRHD